MLSSSMSVFPDGVLGGYIVYGSISVRRRAVSVVKEFGRSQRGVQFEILGLVGLFWAYDKLLFFVYL